MRMSRVFTNIFSTNKWIDIDFCRVCIKCTLAKNQKEVDAAIKSLKSNSKNLKSVIGLNFESLERVLGVKVVSNTPVLERKSYVFLCDGSQCVIVNLSAFSVVPKSLYEFITSSDFRFVGYEMVENIAPRLEMYGLVCKKVLEAGPSFQETLSTLLSLRPGDRDVSSVFRTKRVKLSVASIAEAYAAFYVGDMQSGVIPSSKSYVLRNFLCWQWWHSLN